MTSGGKAVERRARTVMWWGVIVVVALGATGAVTAQERVDARLGPATVQRGDLPAGWNADTATRGDADSPIELCGIMLPEALGTFSSSFRTRQGGAVGAVAMRLPRGQAKAVLDRITRTARNVCEHQIEPGLEGAEPINGRFVVLAAPKLAQQSLRLGLRGAPFSSELVLIRTGDILVIVSSASFAGPMLAVVPLSTKVAARLVKLA